MGADLFPQHWSPTVTSIMNLSNRWSGSSYQLVWFGAYLKRRDTDDFNFLSLAVFGGLLFLTIFEGGRDPLPHQFLPQILLVASIGLAGLSRKKISKSSRLFDRQK